MGSGHGAHEEDDRHDHEARRGDGGAATDRAVAPRVDHGRARGDEHEEERAQSFREQAPPLALGIVEIGARSEFQGVPGPRSLNRLLMRIPGRRRLRRRSLL
jgi:hypothetical protein